MKKDKDLLKIKMFVMDVDGTLTDGKIYIGQEEELFKAFSVKDGLGIKLLLDHGITPVIITARSSDIVVNRARELKIQEVHQGISSKTEVLMELCQRYNLTLDEIAYIGDDL